MSALHLLVMKIVTRTSYLTLPMKKAISLSTSNDTVLTTILPNGLQILTEYVPTVESVAIGVWVNAGSRDETPETMGMAHFIEHVLFRRTTKRSSAALARAFEDLGAYANAFTTKEHTCVYARCLKHYAKQTLELLCEVMLMPQFHPRDIEKERRVIIEEIRSYDDDPEEIIFDEGEKILFGRHPLSGQIAGTVDSVSALKREDILTFYSQRYIPSNMVITVAGNIRHDDIVELCSKLTHSYTTGTTLLSKRKKPRPAKKAAIHVVKDFQQAHLFLGTVTDGIRSQQRYALSVFNTLLGDGMSSRLYQSVRERSGLAYAIYSTIQLLSDCGTLAVYAALDHSQVEFARESIYKEIVKLIHEPCSAKELQRMKLQVQAGIVMSLESMESRMTAMGKAILETGKYEKVESVLEQVGAVTAEDIQACARLLIPEKISEVLFSPQ